MTCVMNSQRSYSSPLRQRQTEETRHRIVEAALRLIEETPEDPLSHERLAVRAGIALRTVYRHFPSRTELLDAVWQESDRNLKLAEYPNTESALLASLEEVFGRMDNHASLIRGLLRSNAGQEMRRRDNERRRTAVQQAVAGATAHLPEQKRRWVVAIFQALYSARTWEMLRDRAHLGEGESAEAVRWAMTTLLQSLHREAGRDPDLALPSHLPASAAPLADEAP